MVSTLGILLFGTFIGFSAAVVLLLYIMSTTTSCDTAEQLATKKNKSSPCFEEDHPTAETKQLLHDAIDYLAKVQEGRVNVSTLRNSEDGPLPHSSLYQLEQTFQTLCSLSKGRAKQLKSLPSFISDVGKAYAAFAKDLSKLSAHARSNIKSSEQQQSIAQQGAADDPFPTSEDSSEYADEWWRSLSLCLSHLSNDNDELSERMSGDYAALISQTCEEQTTEEKKLCAEGSRLLSQLKEGLIKSEHLAQDRDKWRQKVASAPPVKVSVMGTVTSDESSRRIQKLQASELILLENIKVVNQSKNEFRTLMPKIFSSFRSSKEEFFGSMKVHLMKVADGIRQCNKNSDSVTNRLKSHISATSSPSRRIGSGGLETKGVLMGFESMLHASLTSMEKECESFLQVKGLNSVNDTTIGTISPSSSSLNDSLFSSIPKLDMTLESTACLAASASNAIPDLPTVFKSAIGRETCIWFNAFSGRIYRDAARSSYFHSWLLEKLSAGLNKGNKPGFIDEFVVESVTFGSAPPLLFNVQWSPKVVPEKKKKFCERTVDSMNTTSDIAGNDVPSSSILNKNPNGSVDPGSIDKDILSSDSPSSHNVGLGFVDQQEDAKIAIDSFGDSFERNQRTEPTIRIPEPTESNRNPDNNRDNKDSDGDGQREDFNCRNEYPKEDDRAEDNSHHDDNVPGNGDDDIECTADMAYRSGLKFKISTRCET